VGVDGDKKQVLILGGHTGTGSIAIQVAKYFGSNVTCTVKAGAEDWAKRLGADTVSTDGQWWEVREIAFLLLFSSLLWQSFKGQGFDAVFDTVGEEEGFEHSKAVLKDKGAFATELPEYLRKNAGLASWAKQGAVTVGRKIASVASVGYHNAWASVKQQDLEALRLLIEGGDFKSVANHYFPLAEALKAFELVRSGDCLGKVVVTIKDDKTHDIEREFVRHLKVGYLSLANLLPGEGQ
jgi:NADPH2:quinone reductase